jgi:hypothetical protein
LDGVRVLEVASFVFVPASAAILADWGAEVLKIEHPSWGDPVRQVAAWGVPARVNGVSHLFEVGNRGKHALEEILTDEQQFRPGIAEDKPNLDRREAAVDRRETGPRAGRAKEERIPAVMVLGQRRNAVLADGMAHGERIDLGGGAGLLLREAYKGVVHAHGRLARRSQQLEGDLVAQMMRRIERSMHKVRRAEREAVKE